MPSSYDIGVHYENMVRELVESGRYATASEVVRDSLRLLEEREEQRRARLDVLRDDIRKGVESGPSVPGDDLFGRLTTKYRGENRS